MDELFGNLIYLIPIALIIFRVLSAVTGSAKKRQQQQEQQSRKTPNADDPNLDPEVRELLKRIMAGEPAPKTPQNAGRPVTPRQPAPPRPVRPQPVVKDERPHWEREQPRPVPAMQPTTAAKPAKKKPIPQIAPVIAPSFSEPLPEPAPVMPDITAIPLRPQPAAGAAARQGTFPPQSLSPLQQGFVWAEILGPPRGN